MSGAEAGRELLAKVVEALAPQGLHQVELYRKTGRTRRCDLGPGGMVAGLHREEGWAVRASSGSASLFCCAAGALRPERSQRQWPAADGYPLVLPAAMPAPVGDRERSRGGGPPQGFDVPVAVEHEARALLEAIARELARELPQARLLRAAVEDGESRSEIVSTEGIAASGRHRLAQLRLEVGQGDTLVRELAAARSLRDFNPVSLVRRLVDRIHIRVSGMVPEPDRAELVLAPAVAARLLASLVPAFVSPEPDRCFESYGAGGAGSGSSGSSGGSSGSRASGGSDRIRIGSSCVAIEDDGALPQGAFASEIDGEGLATGRTVLVEDGFLVGTLAPPIREDSGPRWGTMRRPSYRDLPLPGPSHLYLRPDRGQPPAALVAGLARGYYLVETQDGGWFDLDADQFRLGVGGFAVRGGRAERPVTGAVLSGKISSLWRGIAAVGRDLTLVPASSMLGAPTVVAQGIALEPA